SLFGRPVVVSRFKVFQAIFEFFSGWAISVFSSIVMVITGGAEKMWKEVSLHRLVLLALFASIALNLFLGGVSTSTYWAEKSAINLSKNIHMVPGSDTVMKRSLYMSELNDLIDEGEEFSKEPT